MCPALSRLFPRMRSMRSTQLDIALLPFYSVDGPIRYALRNPRSVGAAGARRDWGRGDDTAIASRLEGSSLAVDDLGSRVCHRCGGLATSKPSRATSGNTAADGIHSSAATRYS